MVQRWEAGAGVGLDVRSRATSLTFVFGFLFLFVSSFFGVFLFFSSLVFSDFLGCLG